MQPNSVPLSVIYCFKMLKTHTFSKHICCAGFPIFTESSLSKLCTLFKACQTQTICHWILLINCLKCTIKDAPYRRFMKVTKTFFFKEKWLNVTHLVQMLNEVKTFPYNYQMLISYDTLLYDKIPRLRGKN